MSLSKIPTLNTSELQKKKIEKILGWNDQFTWNNLLFRVDFISFYVKTKL